MVSVSVGYASGLCSSESAYKFQMKLSSSTRRLELALAQTVLCRAPGHPWYSSLSGNENFEERKHLKNEWCQFADKCQVLSGVRQPGGVMTFTVYVLKVDRGTKVKDEAGN